jgi:hypothetical protein
MKWSCDGGLANQSLGFCIRRFILRETVLIHKESSVGGGGAAVDAHTPTKMSEMYMYAGFLGKS